MVVVMEWGDCCGNNTSFKSCALYIPLSKTRGALGPITMATTPLPPTLYFKMIEQSKERATIVLLYAHLI